MTLQWIHFDALDPAWLHPAHPAVCILDDAYFEHAGWGLKRLVFIYETLLEMPQVDIYRGPTLDLLTSFGAPIATVDSPDPWLRHQFDALRARGIELTIHPAPSFVNLPPHTDLRRFARYWKKAEPLLFPSRP